MPRRQLVFVAECYYHVYNRGVNHAPVFFGARNYVYFLRLLKQNVERYEVAVTAYCLMPNHYHLLIRPASDDGVRRLMKSLAGSYVQAVNLELGRNGSLFEGRFRAVWVDREAYLMHLARYIHLNPVEAKLVSRPEEWAYSNYRDVIGLRCGMLKDTTLVPGLFEQGQAYRSFVEEGISEADTPGDLEAYWLD
ncbi:MAG: transposase [Anaerolineae bacterium]|nr:transposase [Anaerolineae bacterium]